MSVCVIIAAYNTEKTLARAVTSALSEPEATEIIVVDDASTDSTAALAKSLDDGTGRLKILIQPQNAGPAAARNRAISESTADWLCVLDSDDFFLSGRLSGLLSYAEGYDFIADDMWKVSEHDINGNRERLLGGALTAPCAIDFETFVLSNVSRKGRDRQELGFIKPIMRRAFFTKHHLAYQQHMRLGEDYELYARALGLGARMLLVPAEGYVSVVRENSLSGNHSETDLLHLRNCDNTFLSDLSLTPSQQQALHEHYIAIDCRLQWRMLILAVKQRNIRGIIATFLKPYPVVIYLLRQLLVEIQRRYIKLP